MMIEAGATIGIIGGGQLGRMMAMAAAELGLRVHIYTNEPDSPASHVAYKTTVASYQNTQALLDFAKSVSVITFEFENIPHVSLELLEKDSLVCPSANILRISRNRLREKSFINDLGVATPQFRKVTDITSLKQGVQEIGLPAVLKTTELGYDGKGQVLLKHDTDLDMAWEKLSTREAILEQFIDFIMEISVIVACGIDQKPVCFAPVQNIHKNHILDTTIAPAPISVTTAKAAEEIALKIAQALKLRGLLAIEMFVTQQQEILVNELAPRPHNSGHWTMDACITSQFEQAIRAVCGLPLGNPEFLCTATMKNLLGDDIKNLQPYLNNQNAKLHLYGKTEARPGRKMGHVNILSFTR